MALDRASIPPSFTDLTQASKTKGKSFNVIGVCVDVLDPIKCKGAQKDFKNTFTLHDPEWLTGEGMKFSFFHQELEQLPVIKDQGDVVILRNVKTMETHGLIGGISNSASSWVVLPYAELVNIKSMQDLKVKARWQKDGRTGGKQYPIGAQAALPNEAELKYAKRIAEQENPSRWPPVQTGTHSGVANTTLTNGGSAPKGREKFKLLQQLEIPVDKHYVFADLLGEVRRVYCTDFLTELHVTDYTTNDRLYDYQNYEHQGGQTGDPFGYIKQESGPWPGPWGQMTINIRCRDGQRDLANMRVKPGDFVLLRNIQIVMDKNGMKLEGNCRDDVKFPEKEMIEVVKAGDERRKEVVRRKRAYQEKAQSDGIRFFQNPNQAPKKRQREEEPAEDQPDQPKNKKSKARNREKKKAAKNEAEQQAKETMRVAAAQKERALAANPSVRTHYHQGISNKTIVDILDPDILKRTTPKGNPYLLPFQNCTYKSKIRVVDFFPSNIADFAAPRRVSQYDELSDHESVDEDSDMDLTRARSDEVKWQWRFFLLVEDARLQLACQDRPTKMELLVAEADGDFLLNLDACDLRDKKNENVLASLKEKLFHVWGDLQEMKEECNTTEEVLSVKPSARPFECLIKEYGVPVRNARGFPNDVVVYDRLFRLFGTNI